MYSYRIKFIRNISNYSAKIKIDFKANTSEISKIYQPRYLSYSKNLLLKNYFSSTGAIKSLVQDNEIPHAQSNTLESNTLDYIKNISIKEYKNKGIFKITHRGNPIKTPDGFNIIVPTQAIGELLISEWCTNMGNGKISKSHLPVVSLISQSIILKSSKTRRRSYIDRWNLKTLIRINSNNQLKILCTI